MEVYRQLVDILYSLAELFALPLPEWFSQPGEDWELYQAVDDLARVTSAQSWESLRDDLAKIPRRNYEKCYQEFNDVFYPAGRMPLMLYESYYVDGRILGPTTFHIQNYYHQYALQVGDAELADHISVELSFWAYVGTLLAGSHEQFTLGRKVAIDFGAKHSPIWMLNIGEYLSKQTKAEWKVVGNLLVQAVNDIGTWISHAGLQQHHGLKKAREHTLRPDIPKVENCNLCGFCVQVCPTKALIIYEDEKITSLRLDVGRCVSCRKCERVCESNVIVMKDKLSNQKVIELRQSNRALCPKCGRPTVSQAELAAVVKMLGEHPVYLDYCLECR